MTVDSTLVPIFIFAAAAKERGHQPGIESLSVGKTKLLLRFECLLELLLGLLLRVTVGRVGALFCAKVDVA